MADRGLYAKFLMVITAGVVSSVGLGVTAIGGMSSMQVKTQHLYTQNLLPIEDLGTMQRSVQTVRIHLLNGLVAADEDSAQGYLDKIKAEDAVFDAALASYLAADKTGREKAVAALKDSLARYRAVRDEHLVPAARDRNVPEFRTDRDAMATPALNTVYASLDELVKIETASAAQGSRDATATAARSRLLVIGNLVLGIGVAVGAGLFVARIMVDALRRVAAVAHGLGEADLTCTSGITSRDEVGRMAAALDTAVGRMRATVSRVRDTSQSLAGASQQLSGVSAEITSSADGTSIQAQTASASAEQVSRNVQTVAAATEQMGSSIREISRSAVQAAEVAHGAVQVAVGVSATVSQLGKSSTEIGNVLKMISSIAEQTNLLALNATIEAARAGEAGKGFAVVASEVKDLAQGTAAATQDVSGRIEAIQTDTRSAIEAIEGITAVIEQISGYATTIASAVEEQTTTTSEISRNVAEAATGSGQIAEVITNVATGAQVTASGMAETERASMDLARMSTDLHNVVAAFRL